MTDHLRDETIADALLARDDELEWEAMRNLDLGLDCGWCSDAEQQARWAADRAAVMAEYEPRDFGWWNSDIFLRPWAYDEADPRCEVDHE